MAPLRPTDGWCDAPADRNYNRPVRHPYPASAETLWRDDSLYDIVVVLDCNFTSRARNRGSAIFLHVARAAFTPTEGCIALESSVLRRFVSNLRAGDWLAIGNAIARPTRRRT
jgi:L,D-peptidoglycan transpeptidase YkuD (ErfK/YbiS/YcfS/YnhG family)